MSQMLYRAGKQEVIWGFPVDFIVVSPEEVDAMIEDGWVKSPELTVSAEPEEHEEPEEVDVAEDLEAGGDGDEPGEITVDEAKAILDEKGVSYEGLHWKQIVKLAKESEEA